MSTSLLLSTWTSFEFETSFRIETAEGVPIYEEAPGTYTNEELLISKVLTPVKATDYVFHHLG
jgi:hypothetical protein